MSPEYKDKTDGLDLKTELVSLFPSTRNVKFFATITATNRGTLNFTTKATFLFNGESFGSLRGKFPETHSRPLMTCYSI